MASREKTKTFEGQKQSRSTSKSETNSNAEDLVLDGSWRHSYSYTKTLYGEDQPDYGRKTIVEVGKIEQANARQGTDLQQLNYRFEDYIQKLHFLTAQNRALQKQLDELRDKWNADNTRDYYEAEVNRLYAELNSCKTETNKFKIECKRLKEDNQDLTKELQELKEKNTEYELKIDTLKRSISFLQTALANGEKKVDKLEVKCTEYRNEMYRGQLNIIDGQDRIQNLEKELEFWKKVQQEKIDLLIVMASRDTFAENRDAWMREVGNSILEIKVAYDTSIQALIEELEKEYELKKKGYDLARARLEDEIKNMKEEARLLRKDLAEKRQLMIQQDAAISGKDAQLLEQQSDMKRMEYDWGIERKYLVERLAKYRAELESILEVIRNIYVSTDLPLEKEIDVYRQLLDALEKRVSEEIEKVTPTVSYHVNQSSGGWKPQVDVQIGGLVQRSEDTESVHSRTILHNIKTHMVNKGPLVISESSPDGKFVTIENTSTKDVQAAEWKLERYIDGEKEVDYTFPSNFKVVKGRKVKVYAKGEGRPGDLELAERTNFGLGNKIDTKLLNEKGQEQSKFSQISDFSSNSTEQSKSTSPTKV